MKKYITDERTGLKYELVGDYYLIAGDDEPEKEQKLIGIWGQRHHEYLRHNKQITLSSLQISGKLNDYLADIDRQAEGMFERLVKQMAKSEGVTEQLKAAGAMIYVVVEELVPEAQAGEHSNTGTITTAIGFVVMMILDVALG